MTQSLIQVPFLGEQQPSPLLRAPQGGSGGDAIGRMGEAVWESNWLGAMLMAKEDQNFRSDPNFDPAPLIEPRFEKNSAYLLGATSLEQFEFRKTLLDRQMQNQEIVAESPVLGLAASAVTAIADPTTYVGAGWALRGGTIARAAMRASVQGGSSTAVQALLSNAYNPTGSAADVMEWSLMGAGAGVVLGGSALTGKSGRIILVNQRDGARSFLSLMTERPGIDYSPAAAKQAQRVILTEDRGFSLAESLSAARNPNAPADMNMEGIVPTGIGIEKIPMSPMVRGLNSGVESVSRFMQDLAPVPFFLNKHAEGIAGPTSAATLANVRYLTQSADLKRQTDMLYHEYRGNPGKEGFVAGAVQWAQDLKGRNGFLSTQEFRDRITDQAFSGKFDDPIPQVNKAAREHAAFYDRMGEELSSVGFFSKETTAQKRVWETLEGRIEERYGGPMIWRLDELRAAKEEFMSDWRRWQAMLPETHQHRAITAEDAFRSVNRDRRYTPIDEDMTGSATSLKARGLQVPYQVFKRWLHRDAEGLQRFYARTVGLDMEIGRKGRVQKVAEDGSITYGKPDISMRERINAAKLDFMNGLDTKLEEAGAKAIVRDARSVGPARSAVEAMHGAQAANRKMAETRYAEVMSVLDGEKAASALANDAKAIYSKVKAANDPEAALIAEIRRAYDAEDAKILAKSRSQIEALAEKHGISKAEAGEAFDNMQRAAQDMADARDVLRGTLGQPDDPMGLTPRAVRVAKQLTNMTVLTGVLAQIPDVGGLVMRYGLRDAFGVIFDDLGRRVRGIAPRIPKAELEKAGLTLEMVTQARAAMMSDLTDLHGRYTPLERVVDDLNSLQFTLSLTTGWTDFAQQWGGTLAMNEILSTADKVKRGVALSEAETQAMARSGLTEATLARIADMPGTEKMEGGIFVPDTSKWTNAALAEKFRAAVLDDVDRVIVKSNKIEQPNWISGPVASLIAQYKGFAVSVTNRVLVPALQRKDMKTMVGVVSLVGAGFVVDQIRAYQLGMGDRPMSVQLGRAIERSGVGGWLIDAGRAMDTVTDGRFGYGSLIGDARKESLTELLGPTASQAQKAMNVIGGYAGEWTAKDAADLRGITPFNKIAYLDWMFSGIQQAAAPGYTPR